MVLHMWPLVENQGDALKSVTKSKERTCSKSSNPKKDIECYYCGKLGHISKECHSHLRDIKKGKQIDNKDKDKDKDKDEEKN